MKKIKLIITILIAISIIGCSSQKQSTGNYYYDNILNSTKTSEPFKSEVFCEKSATEDLKKIRLYISNEFGAVYLIESKELYNKYKNKELFLTYNFCQKSEDLKYRYTIVIDEQKKESKVPSIFRPDPFFEPLGPVGGAVAQMILIPLAITGVIILSPFYLIEYIIE